MERKYFSGCLLLFGMGIQKVEGGNLSVSEVEDTSQTLNLWEGLKPIF